jgi:hypothetical protein
LSIDVFMNPQDSGGAMTDPSMARIADELVTGRRASIGFAEAKALAALPQARLFELLDCSQRVTEAEVRV